MWTASIISEPSPWLPVPSVSQPKLEINQRNKRFRSWCASRTFCAHGAHCVLIYTHPGAGRACLGPAWRSGKMGGSRRPVRHGWGHLQRGRPAPCPASRASSSVSGDTVTGPCGAVFVENSTPVYVDAPSLSGLEAVCIRAVGAVGPNRVTLLSPFRFVHQTGAVEAAEGCEVRRDGFLPAISGPGGQPQSSAGRGRGDETQSCEFVSTWRQHGRGRWGAWALRSGGHSVL